MGEEQVVVIVPFYKKKIFLISLFFVFLLILLVCAYFLYPRDACSSDRDCERGYSCIDGSCIQDVEEDKTTQTDSVIPSTQEETDSPECYYDSDCGEGYDCISGNCYEIHEETSGSSSLANTQSSCDDGVCDEGEDCALDCGCEEDADCEAYGDYTCNDRGVCYVAGDGPGEWLTGTSNETETGAETVSACVDEDCGAYVCETESACYGSCDSGEAACTDGYVCDTATSTCVLPCSSDTDCDDGNVCEATGFCSMSCSLTVPCTEGYGCSLNNEDYQTLVHEGDYTSSCVEAGHDCTDTDGGDEALIGSTITGSIDTDEGVFEVDFSESCFDSVSNDFCDPSVQTCDTLLEYFCPTSSDIDVSVYTCSSVYGTDYSCMNNDAGEAFCGNCETNSDCSSGICTDGVCEPACDSDADCNGFLCVDGDCETSCSLTTECASGYGCSLDFVDYQTIILYGDYTGTCVDAGHDCADTDGGDEPFIGSSITGSIDTDDGIFEADMPEFCFDSAGSDFCDPSTEDCDTLVELYCQSSSTLNLTVYDCPSYGLDYSCMNNDAGEAFCGNCETDSDCSSGICTDGVCEEEETSCVVDPSLCDEGYYCDTDTSSSSYDDCLISTCNDAVDNDEDGTVDYYGACETDYYGRTRNTLCTGLVHTGDYSSDSEVITACQAACTGTYLDRDSDCASASENTEVEIVHACDSDDDCNGYLCDSVNGVCLESCTPDIACATGYGCYFNLDTYSSQVSTGTFTSTCISSPAAACTESDGGDYPLDGSELYISYTATILYEMDLHDLCFDSSDTSQFCDPSLGDCDTLVEFSCDSATSPTVDVYTCTDSFGSHSVCAQDADGYGYCTPCVSNDECSSSEACVDGVCSSTCGETLPTCADGIDNEGDGLIDLEDTDSCTTWTDDELFYVSALLSNFSTTYGAGAITQYVTPRSSMATNLNLFELTGAHAYFAPEVQPPSYKKVHPLTEFFFRFIHFIVYRP